MENSYTFLVKEKPLKEMLPNSVNNAGADSDSSSVVSLDAASTKSIEEPTKTSRYLGRIHGLDLARGLAIVGMICVHTQPDLLDSDGVVSFLIDIPMGRSAALFGVLAGVAVAIMTGRNVPYQGEKMRYAQVRIASRALFLFLLASILQVMRTPIELILGFYGMWFLMAIPLVYCSVKQLLIASVALAVTGPSAAILIKATVEYYDLVTDGGVNGALFDALVAGIYPGFAFMTYVLVGLAIGRLNISKQSLQLRLLAIGAFVSFLGYSIAWIATRTFAPLKIDASHVNPDPSNFMNRSRALFDRDYAQNNGGFIFDVTPGDLPDLNDANEKMPWPSLYDFFNAQPHSNTSFEIIGNTGVCLVIIALCLLGAGLSRHILFPLAAVGTMSLSAYVGHAVGLYIFKDIAFYSDSFAAMIITVVSVIVVCTLLKVLRVKRGPLEWVAWKFSKWYAKDNPNTVDSNVVQNSVVQE